MKQSNICKMKRYESSDLLMKKGSPESNLGSLIGILGQKWRTNILPGFINIFEDDK
jgi:hypothetical protein